MGFFSKLFGGNKEAEKAANTLFGEFLKAAEAGKDEKKDDAPQPSGSEAATESSQAAAPDAGNEPSGFSWGAVMPEEENQYNYGGSYTEYFEKIFHEEFPDLTFARKDPKNMWGHVYTFTGTSGTALVVELLSRKSEPKKLREKCRREGTPYLRFYYDYEGWWNTKAYVIGRMKKALGR